MENGRQTSAGSVKSQGSATTMSELAKERSKYMTIPKQPGSQYTNEQRFNVIADLFVIGSITKTAEMHNMPKQTVSNWARSEWGVELLGQIGTEKGEELDANFTKLIDSAFEQAQDRVENGDYRVSKDGKLIRVPMGGKELVISGATVYDKQRLHRNQPTAITGSQDNRALSEVCKELSRTMRDHRVVSVQEESEEVE